MLSDIMALPPTAITKENRNATQAVAESIDCD